MPKAAHIFLGLGIAGLFALIAFMVVSVQRDAHTPTLEQLAARAPRQLSATPAATIALAAPEAEEAQQEIVSTPVPTPSAVDPVKESVHSTWKALRTIPAPLIDGGTADSQIAGALSYLPALRSRVEAYKEAARLAHPPKDQEDNPP